MNLTELQRTEQEQLRQRLYQLFHIYSENYITTVKLLYIYRWLHERAGDDAMTIAHVLYKDWPGRRKLQKIDGMYRAMQTVQLRPLAARPNEQPVVTYRLVGIQKW